VDLLETPLPGKRWIVGEFGAGATSRVVAVALDAQELSVGGPGLPPFAASAGDVAKIDAIPAVNRTERTRALALKVASSKFA